MVNVNCHLHTPYSFSAFKSIDEALDRAAAEDVKVVGINDFYSTDGYREWKEGCAERGLELPQWLAAENDRIRKTLAADVGSSRIVGVVHPQAGGLVLCVKRYELDSE